MSSRVLCDLAHTDGAFEPGKTRDERPGGRLGAHAPGPARRVTERRDQFAKAAATAPRSTMSKFDSASDSVPAARPWRVTTAFRLGLT